MRIFINQPQQNTERFMILPASCEALAKTYESLLRGLKISSCQGSYIPLSWSPKDLGNKMRDRPYLQEADKTYLSLPRPSQELFHLWIWEFIIALPVCLFVCLNPSQTIRNNKIVKY